MPIRKPRAFAFLLAVVAALFALHATAQVVPDPVVAAMFQPDRRALLVPDIADGYGVAFRDLTNDRLPDLYLVCFRTLNRLLINRGPAMPFDDATIASQLGGNLKARGIVDLELGAAAVDVDNDGNADLVVTGWGSTTAFFLNHGSLRFEERTRDLRLFRPADANACAAADVNNDGHLDLFLTDEHHTNHLLVNRGDGTFRDETDGRGLRSDGNSQAAAFSDVDRDGDQDLVVVNWFKPDLFYRNDGGRFSRVASPVGVSGKTWDANGVGFADINNDGDFDMFITNRRGRNVLFENATAAGDTHWVFRDASVSSGLADSRDSYGFAFADFNLDGWLDLFVAGIGPDRCYLNNRDGTFRKCFEGPVVRPGGAPGYSTGVAAADVDADGDPDLFVANKDTFALLYMNSASSVSFLKLKIEGVRSNRDAIGTRVELYAAGSAGRPGPLLGVREVSAGSGYLSSGDPVVLFGTGNTTRLDVRVKFPSGRSVWRENVPTGHSLDLAEYPDPGRHVFRFAHQTVHLIRQSRFWIRGAFLLLYVALAAFFIRTGLRRWEWGAGSSSGFAAGFSLAGLAAWIALPGVDISGRMLALDGAALAVIFLFSVHFERLRRLKHLRRTYRNVLVQLSGRLLLIHDDDALMATVTDTVQRHSEFGLCCAGRFDDAGERIETLRCGGDTADPGILNRMEGLQKFLESLRQKPFLSRGRSSGASVFAALDAEWIVPVRREGRLFGLLGMGRSAPAYKPDRDDLALFQSIANQMAVAFEKNEAIRRSNAMVRELTEAKVRERYLDTLEETNRALESKNAELRKLYDDLKQAETQLVHSEKMASLGRLVAGISHELNNPTAFIYQNMRQLQSYAGRIKAALEGPPSDASRVLGSLLPDIEGLIRDTVNGSQMVKILVDNLRRFSHADRAETRISDVHECIESALLILGSQLKDRIAVHKQYGVKSRIACNPGQLNQVFLNLVANASQAITGKGDVWITTSEQGGELCVEVRDNGKGIAAEHLGKIFDPFFTTKDVGEGTGLGLSIAYSIVKDHGGRIDADSDPGKGSAFTVRLPARPEADAAPDSEDAGRPGPNEP